MQGILAQALRCRRQGGAPGIFSRRVVVRTASSPYSSSSRYPRTLAHWSGTTIFMPSAGFMLTLPLTSDECVSYLLSPGKRDVCTPPHNHAARARGWSRRKRPQRGDRGLASPRKQIVRCATAGDGRPVDRSAVLPPPQRPPPSDRLWRARSPKGQAQHTQTRLSFQADMKHDRTASRRASEQRC